MPAGKTFMAPIKDKFPIYVDGWRACIRGTGDEVQSWTAAKDVGRAVVELCKAETWVSVLVSMRANNEQWCTLFFCIGGSSLGSCGLNVFS